MPFVQVMNAGFENEFFILKGILRYGIFLSLGKFVIEHFRSMVIIWNTNEKLVQGREGRIGAI